MIQAIVFLPLLGAILAGIISLFGAHARCPSGDTVEHHDDRAWPGRACVGAMMITMATMATTTVMTTITSRAGRCGLARGRADHHRVAVRVGGAVLDVFVDVGFMHHDARIALFPWIVSGDLNVGWSLRVDTLTAVMLVVVNTVSSLVHLYSIGYMDEDPYRPRFFGYLVAVHLRDADAGDRGQPRADVLRLGGRRSRELSPDRLLVPEAVGECRGDQGVRRQPRRRFRLLRSASSPSTCC